ncbi:hypothetical protein GCM10028822_26220 [Hymenobacter terrigena]
MRHFYFVLCSVATSSCTLYQPLFTTLPAVRKAGDIAVMGNWQLPYGAQVSAIVSPVDHALVFGTGGLNAYNAKRDSSNSYARSRQYELGLGGYITLGNSWLSAVAGAGQGRGYRYGRFESSDLFFPGAVGYTGGSSGTGRRAPIPELVGSYNTRFVQVTTWWPDVRRPKLEWGASLRVNQVRFTELNLNGIPQPLPSQYYLQNSVVVQQKLGHRFSWQATGTYSFALQEVTNESTFDKAPIRLGLSLIFYPGGAKARNVP